MNLESSSISNRPETIKEQSHCAGLHHFPMTNNKKHGDVYTSPHKIYFLLALNIKCALAWRVVGTKEVNFIFIKFEKTALQNIILYIVSLKK